MNTIDFVFLNKNAFIFVFLIIRRTFVRFYATNVMSYFKKWRIFGKKKQATGKKKLERAFSIYIIRYMRKITIAIDGFSSCGKSTMAKDLAQEIGYIYIDSGAMYRAVTLYALDRQLIVADQVDADALERAMPDIHIEFRLNAHGKPETYLNGENVEQRIRSLEVSAHVSPIAALPFVRAAMVARQQAMGREKGIVMDGRDIGTTVFPEAELKIFVTASPDIRARRRFDELEAKGQPAGYEEILENVKQRDYIDQHREVSPLRQADDAILLDNSHLTIAQQKEWLLEQYRKACES